MEVMRNVPTWSRWSGMDSEELEWRLLFIEEVCESLGLEVVVHREEYSIRVYGGRGVLECHPELLQTIEEFKRELVIQGRERHLAGDWGEI